ncbi:MAG: hypothetical protein M3P98_00980 [bacterium]|nr:hypothetical protein [bacterium]
MERKFEKNEREDSKREVSRARLYLAAGIAAGALFASGTIYALTDSSDAQGVPCDPVIDGQCEPNDTLLKPTTTTGPDSTTTTGPEITTTTVPDSPEITTTTVPDSPEITTTTVPDSPDSPVSTQPPNVNQPAKTN